MPSCGYCGGRLRRLNSQRANRYCSRRCHYRGRRREWVAPDGPPWVEVLGPPNVVGPCWQWDRTLTDGGYGHIHVLGVPTCAHRWVYEMAVGPIPHGLELDHACRNRACVNPAHLEPVEHAENLRRGRVARGVEA